MRAPGLINLPRARKELPQRAQQWNLYAYLPLYLSGAFVLKRTLLGFLDLAVGVIMLTTIA